MKRAFTMIELIFAIVILGILASVAIPRLAAMRDDARIAARATDLTNLISDIQAYNVSQGGLSNKITEMTQVAVTENPKNEHLNGALDIVDFDVADKRCLVIRLFGENDTDKVVHGDHYSGGRKPAFLYIQYGMDAYGAGGKLKSDICKKFVEVPGVKALLESKFEYYCTTNHGKPCSSVKSGEIPISGVKVQF